MPPPPPKKKVVASPFYKNTAAAEPAPATTPGRASFASRGSIGGKKAVPPSSSPIPSDMPKGGLSVRDRMKSWGKATPLSSTEPLSPATTPSKRPVVVAPSSLPAHPLQPSGSVDTQDSISKKSHGTDDGSIQTSSTSGAASSTQPPAQSSAASVRSPPPSYAGRTLKKITPPMEDKHKHQKEAFVGRQSLPTVGLKKVAPPVEDKHKVQKEAFVGQATLPTVGLKKTPKKEQPEESAVSECRPSLYSAQSLRSVAKPDEQKWKTSSSTQVGRPSLYSAQSLRNVEKPKESFKEKIEEKPARPVVALKNVGAPPEDKWKQAKNNEEETPAATLYTPTKLRSVGAPPEKKPAAAVEEEPAPVYSATKLRSVGAPPDKKSTVAVEEAPAPVYSATKLRQVEKPREDKWRDLRTNAFNEEAQAMDEAVVAAPTPPPMPTGEKTEEKSPEAPPTPAPVVAQSTEPEELTLDELALESPANAPKVPPSPLEQIVKQNVEGSTNKILMLMSSMSGRQDQKTAQDRALTILKGMRIGDDQMELLDGADPVNKERRNELFSISGIRAQYPQFFLVDEVGKTTFLGDWDSFEMMNDSGNLGESMNLGGSQGSVAKAIDFTGDKQEATEAVNATSDETKEKNLADDIAPDTATEDLEDCFSEHLKGLSQPSTHYEEDAKSLDCDDLWDDVEENELPAKPLLAAALKAKEESEHQVEVKDDFEPHEDQLPEFEEEDAIDSSQHLNDLNQPKTKYDDDTKSLDTDELFDHTEDEELPDKPLLAAALKAKEQSDHNVKDTTASEPAEEDVMEFGETSEHLKDLNQPKTKYDDDTKSLDSDELFDDVEEANVIEKPLLAAALKAKEESEHQKESDMQEPIAEAAPEFVNDDDCIDSSAHLNDLNQPKTKYDDDTKSLDSDELFDEYTDDVATDKPLLAAALKAKEQSEHNQQETSPETAMLEDDQHDDFAEDEIATEYLNDLNQPKTSYEDERSLDSDELFDDVVEDPVTEKPLLAAALKAKVQSDVEHEYEERLLNLNQPKTKYEDDKSLDSDELFDEMDDVLPEKPLLAAALKAKEQSGHDKAPLDDVVEEESAPKIETLSADVSNLTAPESEKSSKEETDEGSTPTGVVKDEEPKDKIDERNVPTIEQDLLDNPAPVSDLTVFTSGEESTDTIPAPENGIQDSDLGLPIAAVTSASTDDTESVATSEADSVEQDADDGDEQSASTDDEDSVDDETEIQDDDATREPRADSEQPEPIVTAVGSTGDDDDVNEKAATPKKSGGKPSREMPEPVEIAKRAAPSLTEHFGKRSSDSDSSEASDGGWTEVHDESVSSATDHSVQTSGTLGSAIIVDATIGAQKNPTAATMAVKPMDEVSHDNSPKKNRPPRPESSSPKKKKSSKAKASVDTEDVTRNLKSPPKSPKKKLKGKKSDVDFDVPPSPNLSSRSLSFDKDDSPSKKKKKKKVAVTDGAEEPKTPSSSKEKKSKKKIKVEVDAAADATDDVKSPAATPKTPSSTSSKKKKSKIKVQIDEDDSKPAAASSPRTPSTSPTKKKSSAKSPTDSKKKKSPKKAEEVDAKCPASTKSLDDKKAKRKKKKKEAEE